MAKVIIKDLPESIELDREAIHAVLGGARDMQCHVYQVQKALSSSRIVDYPSRTVRNMQPIQDLLSR